MKIVANLSQTIKHICLLSVCGVMLVLLTNCSRLHADNSTSDVSVFDYREVYLPEGIGKHAEPLGLNSVDEDWGIWGHNLEVVVPESPMMTIYARVNGGVDKTQFCFMSNTLYDYIVQYIDDTDTGEPRSFAILPNDNSKVCQCTKCKAEGNTKTNASPAVTNMICKLAKRFPKHKFFTSYYYTTRQVPDIDLPSNVGVLISAINFPLTVDVNKDEERFSQLISVWKQKTEHVYIWDYINNFDDYFTPYPIFKVMQHRLQLYNKLGVTGIFLNGSGTDYSSLSRVKTYALAALLIDPTADYHDVIVDICDSYYPVTGHIIEKYLEAVDELVTTQHTSLPLYEGVPNSLKSYIPKDAFITFYNELETLLPKTKGQEKREMEMLFDAMQLTMLEIKRLDCDTTGMRKMIDQLNAIRKKGVTSYSESGWTVEELARDYEFMYQHAQEAKNNLLLGAKLRALDPLDEDYPDISILTDGLIGLPSNYHSGHMIYSKQTLRIIVPAVKNMQKINVCLARNKPYHILFPQRVTLTINGKPTATLETKKINNHPRHSMIEFSFPKLNGDEQLMLIFERNEDERSIAIDEIEGY